MTKKCEFNKILLLEGNDDLHVMGALFKKYGINENFCLREFGGIDQQLKAFSDLYLTCNAKDHTGNPFRTIGLIIDADQSLSARWDEIQKILQLYTEYKPSLTEKGLILDLTSGIRVGVWIMPNNNKNGMLEDFIDFLIPTSDNLLSYVNSLQTEIENSQLNRYKLIHKQKSKIHIWLALQQDPGTPMGLAITKKYLDDNVINTDKNNFLQWIQELFK